MGKKLTTLLRKVFIGSIAGIAASNTTVANANFTFPEENENEKKLETFFNWKNDLNPKLLLKKSANDEWEFASHRSHRSHSSHRSHYSSYSGGGSSNNSTPTNSGNSGISPNYNNENSKSGTNSNVLQLGARTLKKGMSGTDVTELVNILLRKKYLKLEDGGTQVTGSFIFDETIEGAVKKFQSDNGLTSDGVCGPTTIYYLKNK